MIAFRAFVGRISNSWSGVCDRDGFLECDAVCALLVYIFIQLTLIYKFLIFCENIKMK
jgi:hypothetical protein